MLEKARERIVDKGLRNCRVLEMDAAAMTFPDESFDIVYAPYLISVVPDPVKVAQEMRRVCRRAAASSILNHFKSSNRAALAGSKPRSRRSPCTSASSPISISTASSRRPTSHPIVDREGQPAEDVDAGHLPQVGW